MAAELTPREKFTNAMRKLVTVPKTEILRREKEYKAERKRKQTKRQG
jgi:hypothetical protein